jgi:hypothetical protein
MLSRNQLKPWLREAAIVAISERIEQKCRSLSYGDTIERAGHADPDAFLQTSIPTTLL